MWADHALPRLRTRGLGADVAVRTYRLTGIGESQVAEILGESMLRNANPEVATYARAEAVDVRISATEPERSGGCHQDGGGTGRGRRRDGHRSGSPATSGPRATRPGRARSGHDSRERGWRLGLVELGTGGQVMSLFGDVDWIALAEARPDDAGHRGRARVHADRSRPRDPAAGRSRGRVGGPRPRARRRHGRVRGGRDRRFRAPRDAPRVPGRESRSDPRRADRGRRAVHRAARRGGLSAGSTPAACRRCRRSAARGRAQPLQVRDHDRVTLQSDQPVVRELAQELVHALARAADHRREIRLGQVRPEPERAVRERQSRRPGRAGRAGRRGAR